MNFSKNVAGYIRVSTENQVKEGESLTEQKRMIEEYAKFHNCGVVKIYADQGVSGIVSNRASLDDLKRDASQNLFQKVIFYSLDRFGRSAQDLLYNYEYFEKRGISLVSLREELDTSTATGRFLRTVLGAVAELEREMIRDRTIIGATARMKKGLRPVGRLPYGYSWDKRRRNFKIIRDERKGYDLAVDLLLNKHKSVTEIAGILNEEGYRTKQGNRFTHPSLSRIFKNPFYKGELTFRYQGEKFSYNPPSLVNSDTWDKILHRIKENTKKFDNYEPERDPFILRGLLKCECGSSLSCTKFKQRYYECFVSKISQRERLASNLKRTCSLPYINAVEIENYVLNSILRQFQISENDMINRKENIDFSRKKYLESQLTCIKIRIEEKEGERKRLIHSYAIGCVDKSFLRKKDQELKSEISILLDKAEVLGKELGYIEKSQQKLERSRDVEKDFKKSWPEIDKAFTNLTDGQRKEFISEALSGKQLKIRILRRRDIVESTMGLSKEELNSPVYKIFRGRKRIAWIVEGDWNFNLNSILKYLFQKHQIHFSLTNYGIPVLLAPI